jgi:hypothetical protein
MTSPLENLAGPGRALKEEKPDDAEIQGLIRAGFARLDTKACSMWTSGLWET